MKPKLQSIRTLVATPRLSDFWEGFKWFLARGAEMGYLVPRNRPETYVIHFYHWNEAEIKVAYRLDDDHVEILDISVTPVQ